MTTGVLAKKKIEQFCLVSEKNFIGFQTTVVSWYETEVESTDELPLISGQTILGYDHTDTMNDLFSELVQELMATQNEYYPNDVEVWSDSDYENLDDEICGGYQYYLSCFEEDVMTLFDALNMPYLTEVYLVGMKKYVQIVHNQYICEVW